MSEHAQALMLSTKVHAVFGDTLMLAGATRIIEVCFIAPRFVPLPEAHTVSDDNHSEHTLTEGNSSNKEETGLGKGFRHLPPFVSVALSTFSGSG